MLLRFVRDDVGDEQLVFLITTWLAAAPAGYRRRWFIGPREAVGLVQGGILSPVLSNAYLHRFDQALAAHDIKLVRFADDFLAFTKTQEAAQRALQIIERELKLDTTIDPIVRDQSARPADYRTKTEAAGVNLELGENSGVSFS